MTILVATFWISVDVLALGCQLNSFWLLWVVISDKLLPFYNIAGVILIVAGGQGEMRIKSLLWLLLFLVGRVYF